MRPALFFLVLALAPSARQSPADERRERPPLERPGVLELTLPPLDGVEIEWFRIDPPAGVELPPPAEDAPGENKKKSANEPLGLVRIVRVPERDGSLRLESETIFFDIRTRVAHVEHLGKDALELVWRAVGPDHGRTMHLAWTRGEDCMRVADTSEGEVRRREIDASDGVLMPLYLLERQRLGQVSPGVFRRFEPNAGAVESLRHDLEPPLARLFGRGRLSCWRRPDGALAGRYFFCGDRLLAFQLQHGGPVARAVSEPEYERLRAERWSDTARR